jgi:MraZ protein
MALFLSSHQNRIDKKGRVSVPASFRAELAQEPFQGVVLFKSSAHPCLEGFPWSYMKEISERLDNFNLFSEEQDDLATAIFGSAVQLPLDGDGRIILPADLITFGGLEEKASFVGMGTKFQIWNPELFDKRQAEARKAVQQNGLSIPKKGGGE